MASVSIYRKNKGVGEGITFQNQIKKESPLFTVHGTVAYDYLYRSLVDTPYQQEDFQQHSLQVALKITVKDRYPVTVRFSPRINNSPWFKNLFDANFQFDKNAYLVSAKQRLLERLNNSMPDLPDLTKLKQEATEELRKIQSLMQYLNSSDKYGELIKQRERAYLDSLAEIQKKSGEGLLNISDSGKIVQWRSVFANKKEEVNNKVKSADSSYRAYVNEKQQTLDSLKRRLQRIEQRRDSIEATVQKRFADLRQKIHKVQGIRELQKIGLETRIDTVKQKGFEKFLSNISSIGIGRSMVNYSELTAWNVALTGFSVEYNSKVYAALAVGKVDYGFRNLLHRDTRSGGQQLLIGRVGWGDKERRAVIVSGFTGKKFNSGTSLPVTGGDLINVLGYSVEGIWKKDAYTGINVELAKTSLPVKGTASHTSTSGLWQFSDNSNLGISIKGQTRITPTETLLSGLYRKTGAQFQSFSLFSYNTDQSAWLIKVEQPLFKRRIDIVGSLRRNDFANPFAEKTFKTSTIFKSIQLNTHFPKWPVVSVGYYPGAQLYITDSGRLKQNVYYMFNGSMVYQYQWGDIRMSSSLFCNRFSNKATDSVLIAYNGINYMASQLLFFGRFQLQGSYAYTDQETLRYNTWELSSECAIGKIFRLSNSVRWNKIQHAAGYLGGGLGLQIDAASFGGFQLNYEKSYLPTTTQSLLPVETGRIGWYKNF